MINFRSRYSACPAHSLLVACLCLLTSAHSEPLAQHHSILYEVRTLPDPDAWICVGSPDLIQLPSGRLVASMELWLKTPTDGREGGIDYPHHCKIKASDDGGETWSEIGSTGITWGSLFHANDVLYLLGNDPLDRSIRIARSRDDGATWEATVPLFSDSRYHGTASNVLIKDGKVFKAFEDQANDWASFVLVGDLSKDLADPAAWIMSPKVNAPQEVGALVPPGAAVDARWLEGNIVDMRGELRVLLRTRIGNATVAGVAAVCDLTDDGTTLNYTFRQYHAMAGAQNKFKILYDAASDLFWTVSTLVPDPYQPIERLAAKGFKGPAANERRIAMLQYSYDGLNWFQAGCVAMSNNPLESFHYTSQLPVGDDLLVLSRTSTGGGRYNNHDTNRITLHRVKNFRNLALDLTPTFDVFGK
jgi:hypothetical protein